MKITGVIRKKTNQYISARIKWSRIKFNPEQKKNYKIARRIDEYVFSSEMRISEDIKERIRQKQTFEIADDEVRISFDGQFLTVEFEKEQVFKKDKQIKGNFVNYGDQKSLEGLDLTFVIKKALNHEKYTEEELKEINRERHKRLKGTKGFKDNPYPVRAVYRGGSMTPR